MILTMHEPKHKRIVFIKMFAQLFAANERAPHLRLCCVSRLSRRACHAVLRDARRSTIWLFSLPKCMG